MAHLIPTYIAKTFSTEPALVCKNASPTTRSLDNGTWKRSVNSKNKATSIVHCCGSTSTASSSPREVVVLDRRNSEDEMQQPLVNEFGWKVRRLANDQDEMKQVAQLQAEAFHTPVALFDDLFFQFFKAEVLSGLLYKLRNSTPDRYACLVAEPAADATGKSRGKLVGIVDVTAMRDAEVLQHLDTVADEYLYVSGIAVSKSLRRQKIATVLLKACDVLSCQWGFEYTVLRAYEDDWGARKLYANAGYRVISTDPQWMAWMGRRRRVLMIKRFNLLNRCL